MQGAFPRTPIRRGLENGFSGGRQFPKEWVLTAERRLDHSTAGQRAVEGSQLLELGDREPRHRRPRLPPFLGHLLGSGRCTLTSLSSQRTVFKLASGPREGSAPTQMCKQTLKSTRSRSYRKAGNTEGGSDKIRHEDIQSCFCFINSRKNKQ